MADERRPLSKQRSEDFVPAGTTVRDGKGAGPSNSFLGEYYCRLLIGKYERTRPFEPNNWKFSKSIFLPLPTPLVDESLANYTDVNLGPVGNILNNDAVTGLGAIALDKSGNMSMGLAAAAFKVPTQIAKSAGITPEKITSAIQQSIGVAPNPNPSVQFVGPDLREFTLSWSFYPRTKDESENIDYMIRHLKSSALPSHTFTNSTAILNYPDLCQINFFPWDTGGADNQWGWTDKSILRFKKCFLKNVRVSYSEFGNPAFFEGTQLPVAYRLTISFQETEYMLSENWGTNQWTNPISNQDVLDWSIGVGGTVLNSINPAVPSADLLSILTATLGAEGE